jgi:hypothetical protein
MVYVFLLRMVFKYFENMIVSLIFILMETPLEILINWIVEENLTRNIDVADVYIKAKELLENEKKFVKLK